MGGVDGGLLTVAAGWQPATMNRSGTTIEWFIPMKSPCRAVDRLRAKSHEQLILSGAAVDGGQSNEEMISSQKCNIPTGFFDAIGLQKNFKESQFWRNPRKLARSPTGGYT